MTATDTEGPKYPNVTVRLSGEDGNAFVILGRVDSALRRASVPPSERYAFQEEATSGDYNHLLRTAMAWVNVQ